MKRTINRRERDRKNQMSSKLLFVGFNQKMLKRVVCKIAENPSLDVYR